ncbi:uncharacterized protein AMSG_11747 [Thecamonas trahens ATCC 50062]|uniref:Uncharacterized protein n=1 Tax=Thecamonas trahens ATCC 50062 TaxID=461836 RepID=A0A0L0D3C6_THETB|nr:hypothetical protein AMSG_11747 [Thecamonas trahens ATCC 50062]KNC46680.1 hypothetical protein AMSG_11747 [Thecamonas trahens ATCC 50062]|eukprot:XP_013760496.1 hypothetical protein AMSG_11747 [Thecamonas trahens ATCC 50062]
MGGALSSADARVRLERYLPFTETEQDVLNHCASSVSRSTALGLLGGSAPLLVLSRRFPTRINVFTYMIGGGFGLWLGYRAGVSSCEERLASNTDSALLAELKVLMQEAAPSRTDFPWQYISSDELEAMRAADVREPPRAVRRTQRALEHGAAVVVGSEWEGDDGERDGEADASVPEPATVAHEPAAPQLRLVPQRRLEDRATSPWNDPMLTPDRSHGAPPVQKVNDAGGPEENSYYRLRERARQRSRVGGE